MLARENNPINNSFLPVNDQAYVASPVFGTGDNLGPHAVVYAGIDSTFVLTNLTAAATYYFTVIEFNTSGTAISYLTANPPLASQAVLVTVTEPTLPASNLVFSDVTDNSMRVSMTPGNGQQRLVLARAGTDVNGGWLPVDGQQYAANAQFGTGDNLGPNTVVFNGADSTFELSGLTSGLTYHVAVVEYNSSNGVTNYLSSTITRGSQLVTSAVAEPLAQPSGINFTAVTDSSVTVAWQPVGEATGTLVLARAGQGIHGGFIPADATFYTPGTAFGQGDNIGPNEVAYVGSGSSFTLTDLPADSTVHLAFFAYNANEPFTNINYLQAGFVRAQQTTSSAESAALPQGQVKAYGQHQTLHLTFSNPQAASGIIQVLDLGGTVHTTINNTGNATSQIQITNPAFALGNLFLVRIIKNGRARVVKVMMQ